MDGLDQNWTYQFLRQEHWYSCVSLYSLVTTKSMSWWNHYHSQRGENVACIKSVLSYWNSIVHPLLILLEIKFTAMSVLSAQRITAAIYFKLMKQKYKTKYPKSKQILFKISDVRSVGLRWAVFVWMLTELWSSIITSKALTIDQKHKERNWFVST